MKGIFSTRNVNRSDGSVLFPDPAAQVVRSPVNDLPPACLFSPLRDLTLAAFSLVEIIIALGIFSFVIVAILGTMTVALNSTRSSEMKLRASHTGATIIGVLKANPSAGTNTSFPIPDLKATNGNLANSGTDEKSGIIIDLQGRVLASASDPNATFQLAWRVTRDGEMTNLVYCYLDMSWPPAAPATNANGSHRFAATVLLPP